MNDTTTEIASQFRHRVSIHLNVQGYKHMSTQLNDHLWLKLRDKIRNGLIDKLSNVIGSQLESENRKLSHQLKSNSYGRRKI